MKRLFTVLPLLLLAGCTITKRHFGTGYHVEWKKSYSKTEHEAYQLNVTDSGRESSVMPDENEEIPKVISTDTMHRAELISPDLLEISIEEPTGFSETPVQSEIKPVIESDQILGDEDAIDEPKRKVEPFTWAALGALFLGLLLLLTISFDMVLGVLTGLGILLIIFSIISLIRIVRHPELYKAKGLTWTLFWLSMAGISGGLVILIFYLLLITNNVDLL
ncbi:hypothetical protein [uncultured Fluviicola sp.]|uniref:hypothetical protein n=1 Tax=uncultured Fluviicola sp. TaxID=463303 RepID=UPI0025D524BE|nr:hypothetical protein [uncultured Fluviicola sp.]